MKIVVQKFGGSSLTTAEMRQKAASHVKKAWDNGLFPVVVVSAIGRMGNPYSTDTLIKQVEEVNNQYSLRNMDMMMSCGEIISAVIMAETLNSIGLKAEALTGWQSGIVTDDRYGNARIVSVDHTRIKQSIDLRIVPVVAGFQGVTENNEVTTLGRGGSDTTASVLAYALDADCIEIFTDVDGVKTADPRLVPDAQTLKCLTYQEVVELAHLGAKVIHPRAVEIAMEKGIPLRILSTETGKGTLVIGQQEKCDQSDIQDRVATGIAHMSRRTQVRIYGSFDFAKTDLAIKIFDVLAQYEVSLDLIHLSQDLIAFTVESEKADLVKKVLAPYELNIEIKSGFAKVSIVGAGMHGVPGVMARIVRCLGKEKISVFQTTDSHANISCLIQEEELPRTVHILHEEFSLSKKGVSGYAGGSSYDSYGNTDEERQKC